MDKFIALTGAACPIDQSNVNTDQILPARYLKWTRAMGIGKVLFQDLRFDAEGKEKPDFPLNKPAWRDAKIVVAARNFGCGSSREGRGLCALRPRHTLRHRAVVRRHLFRQCRAERAADGDRQRTRKPPRSWRR